MSSPMSRIPPEYDELQSHDYDPQFTADISTKMRVPDNIRIAGGGDPRGDYSQDGVGYRAASMQVSDRIVIMGQDQHAELRPEPDLKMDFVPHNNDSSGYVGLSTPPRVLTLEERPFPGVEEDNAEARKETLEVGENESHGLNGYVQRPSSSRDMSGQLSMMSNEGLLLHDDMDDFVQLKRQVAKLTRHVMTLEEESAQRKNRELILYPIIGSYFLLKLFSWFFRSK